MHVARNSPDIPGGECGLGPGVFEAGDDGEGAVDELGVVVDVGGDEVAVDGEVDAGELGGVFPGCCVEGVKEGCEEFLGVDEVVVGVFV